MNLASVLNSILHLRIFTMALIPKERFYISVWVDCHHKHCFLTNDLKPSSPLLGDYIIAGLSRFPYV